MKYVSDENGKWIPVHERKAKQRTAPHIMPDLPDYAPVAGPEAERILRKDKDARYISGRKQHREFLKRNGFIEVGNDLKNCTGKTRDNPTKDWHKYGGSGNWTRPDLERLMKK